VAIRSAGPDAGELKNFALFSAIVKAIAAYYKQRAVASLGEQVTE
jgi:hypothetical protein